MNSVAVAGNLEISRVFGWIALLRGISGNKTKGLIMKDEKSATANQSAEMFERVCPVCRAKFGAALCKIRFETFEGTPLDGNFALVICGQCGFCFNDFPLVRTNFSDYYGNDTSYLTSGTMSVGGSQEFEEKRLESFAKRLASYIPSPNSKIIDVGSSRGGLLTRLARRGFTELYGVDPNPGCVRFIEETLGFKAAEGSAELLPFGDMRADVLVYSHVIEHVIELSTLLSFARDRLNDDGIICVEVPDASRYQDGSVLPFQSLYLEHVNHFNPDTLVNYLSAHGFEVVSLELLSEIHSARGVFPCIWAVFRQGKRQELRNTKGLEIALRNYIDWSNHHPLMEQIRRLSVDRTPVYLWGISYYALLLLGQTDLRFCNIAGFVDKDQMKQNCKVMNLPIQSPEILVRANPIDVVIITALGYEPQIVEELKSMAFAGKTIRLLKNDITEEP